MVPLFVYHLLPPPSPNTVFCENICKKIFTSKLCFFYDNFCQKSFSPKLCFFVKTLSTFFPPKTGCTRTHAHMHGGLLVDIP